MTDSIRPSTATPADGERQALIERLSELLASATERPWRVRDDVTSWANWISAANDTADICEIGGGWPIALMPEAEANAVLIAEAINALPKLLAFAKQSAPPASGGMVSVPQEPTEAMLAAAAAAFPRSAPFVFPKIWAAMLSALPAPAGSDRDAAEEEAYEIGKRDGFEEAVQRVDLLTGGDGEYFASTIPGRGCPDAETMIQRIVARFEALPPSSGAAQQDAGARERERENIDRWLNDEISTDEVIDALATPTTSSGREDALACAARDLRATYEAAKSGKPIEISIGQWGRLRAIEAALAERRAGPTLPTREEIARVQAAWRGVMLAFGRAFGDLDSGYDPAVKEMITAIALLSKPRGEGISAEEGK